jgi:DNA-binding CsgD family transcriptional regulator
VPIRQISDGKPGSLAVEVRLGRPRRRAAVAEFLATQPLLPRWRLRVVDGPHDASAGAVQVTIVGTLWDPVHVPAQRATPGLVAMLDDPGEIASWRGVGCLLLASEPTHRLARAIAEAADGNVWLSALVASHLPKVVGGAADYITQAPSAVVGPRDGAALTPAEEETLALVMQGLSNAEIAVKRGVKLTTVKSCVRSVLRKHGCQRRQELIAALLSPDRPR